MIFVGLWSQGRKTPLGRKERTAYSPYKEKTEMVQNTRKKRHLQKKNKSIKTKTKQNKTNVTPEKEVRTSANQTPGGHKFAALVASQQGRANQHEPTCFGLSSPWSFPSRWGIPLHAVVQPCFFFAAINFAMKYSTPCSPVLRHSPSSWAAVLHWSALMPKALRPSRKHPIHSLFCPPIEPAPPTISMNITHFDSLVSSMRATNPANKIRLLRKVASMLSLRLNKRVQIGNRVVGAIVLVPTCGGLSAACRSGTRAGST